MRSFDGRAQRAFPLVRRALSGSLATGGAASHDGLLEALRGKNIFDPRDVSYAVVETNGSLSAALRPEKETATLADLQLKVEHSHATIPFVLDGQVLEENLHWCGKDRAWLERTAQANTLLPQEILLLVGNETEDYFLLKKERRATVHEGRK